jgi:SWI/SNF-related matrix-associated actin-dependent regulator 1 of chromatin subfamily A
MTLYPHQEIARDFLLARKRCILADSPRVGKTLAATAAAIEHMPALVVCPAVAKPVWKKAFEQMGITAVIVNGRKMAEECVTGGVLIVNYDLLQYVTAIDGWQTLILDESHRIKTPTAKRTKFAMKIMKATPRVYCLSGTPISNRPIEIWTVLHGLGIYKGSWIKFAYRYAKAWQSPWGFDVSGASNLPELKKALAPHVLRRTRADVFKNYQQPVISMIELDLPIDRREKQFDAEVLVQNPNLILALDGLSEIMREGGIRKVPLALDFIKGKLEDDPEESLVVFAWHKDVAAMLRDGLKDYQPVMVTGETPAADRQKHIDAFQSGEAKVIIGNIATLSEGVDLSKSSTVIFVEATWATSAFEQASARVENIQKFGIAPAVYILTTRNSLDHTILSKVLKKLDIIEQIL